MAEDFDFTVSVPSFQDVVEDERARWLEFSNESGMPIPVMPPQCDIFARCETADQIQQQPYEFPMTNDQWNEYCWKIFMEGAVGPNPMPPWVTHPMMVFGIDSRRMLIADPESPATLTEEELETEAQRRYEWLACRDVVMGPGPRSDAWLDQHEEEEEICSGVIETSQL